MKSSPPPKRRRTDEGLHLKLNPASPPCAGSMIDDSSFHLVPVLADNVTCPLPVQMALVACITDRRQTAALVARLASEFPVAPLAHLKRVRTVRVDGAPVLFLLIDLLENIFPRVTPSSDDSEAVQQDNEAQPDLIVTSATNSTPVLASAPTRLGRSLSELESVLTERGVTSALPGLSSELYSAPVATARPITRRQYDQAACLWPTVFHRDLRVEASLAPPSAGPAERRRLLGWMAAAAEAARAAAGPRVGCAIVDPATDRLVAAAGDTRGRHVLQHAVMRAVDAVAAAQGGGAWSRPVAPSQDLSIPSSTSSEQPPDKPRSSLAAPRPTTDQSPPPPPSLPSADHREKPPAERPPPAPASNAPSSSLPYLCTSYDAFITREPCTMCAMALLHSRIGRVFYAVTRPDGALGSACKLHVTEGLNHRFQVFSGLGTELCQDLEDGDRTVVDGPGTDSGCDDGDKAL